MGINWIIDWVVTLVVISSSTCDCKGIKLVKGRCDLITFQREEQISPKNITFSFLYLEITRNVECR